MSQLFEIVRNEDYGKPLPNDILKPQNGDTYVLYGFNIQLVSDQYVPAGEEELYDTAVKWLTDNNKDKSVFDCPTMIQHFADNELDLGIGQKIKLIHGQFETGFRSSRIQGYEKHLLNKYKATYTVADNAAYSWPKEVSQSIKELQIAGISYSVAGNNIYVIKQYDNTPASEFNVYSAKRSRSEFLFTKEDDIANGQITFKSGIVVQADSASDVSSGLMETGETSETLTDAIQETASPQESENATLGSLANVFSEVDNTDAYDVVLARSAGDEKWSKKKLKDLQGKDGVIVYPTIRLNPLTGRLILSTPTDNYENRFFVVNGHLIIKQS